MAQTHSIETQIDCFLEQFKRNASKALEQYPNIRQSRSLYFDAELPDKCASPCEEIEMVNTNTRELLGVNEVADLLNLQCAFISGGKSKEGCLIVTFPDNNTFNLITDAEYQRLMLYLTSVPSLQEADHGFNLIIDRRKDKWTSVKTALLKISAYFPGLIHVVYVIRPESFLQKALSEVSNKLFKDEFKFRVIVLNTIEELYEYIDSNQITADMGGTLQYSHEEWMKQRVELEKFSSVTLEVSSDLDRFTKSIGEVELPNNVDSTQQVLDRQNLAYSEVKENILSAARHGEKLLYSFKEKLMDVDNSCGYNTAGSIFAIERLLVQLEETERTFDSFWQQHLAKLRYCLKLRRFEQDFRELQNNFTSHLKIVDGMIEDGDNLNRIDSLINDSHIFEKLCSVDVERAEEVLSSGQNLIKEEAFCPLLCVEPKCTELVTMKDALVDKLLKLKTNLVKTKEIMKTVETFQGLCANGVKLLSSQDLEGTDHPVLLANYVREINEYLATLEDTFQKNSAELVGANKSHGSELELVINQVLQEIDEVKHLSEERITTLKASMVSRNGSLLMQSLGGSTEMDNTDKNDSTEKQVVKSEFSPCTENEEQQRVKTGHVLSELLETEKFYVSELLSIIRGYKMEVSSKDMQRFVTPDLEDNLNAIFGNLEEIYSFHAEIFLQNLENCISSIDLVALCFVQHGDAFFRLYSCYCQNIPRSEHLRDTLEDCKTFLQICQRKLGHKLPLGAYLLKPVQRITKYQLLLRDLLRYSEEGKCKELQQALDCMLVVLKCVNDSMYQVSIIDFPYDLSQQGDLLLQGSFSVWIETKKDLRLRLKPTRRHIFLYQKSILFCKTNSKSAHDKASYNYKYHLKMSQVGLTETVKGDPKKFEIWLQGRQEVYTIQTANVEQKQSWVNEIKRVLFNQLEELKEKKIQQYTTHSNKFIRESWDEGKNMGDLPIINTNPEISCDNISDSSTIVHKTSESMTGENWTSDCSVSDDDEEHLDNNATSNGRYIALADYCAAGNSEINIKEGEIVELLRVGCAGWWFVKVIASSVEGWAPAAYLENLERRPSQRNSRT